MWNAAGFHAPFIARMAELGVTPRMWRRHRVLPRSRCEPCSDGGVLDARLWAARRSRSGLCGRCRRCVVCRGGCPVSSLRDITQVMRRRHRVHAPNKTPAAPRWPPASPPRFEPGLTGSPAGGAGAVCECRRTASSDPTTAKRSDRPDGARLASGTSRQLLTDPTLGSQLSDHPRSAQMSQPHDYYARYSSGHASTRRRAAHTTPVEGFTSEVVLGHLRRCRHRVLSRAGSAGDGQDGYGELGRGGPGLTMLGGGDLKGLTEPGDFIYCGEGPSTPVRLDAGIGGLAHELGHASWDFLIRRDATRGMASCELRIADGPRIRAIPRHVPTRRRQGCPPLLAVHHHPTILCCNHRPYPAPPPQTTTAKSKIPRDPGRTRRVQPLDRHTASGHGQAMQTTAGVCQYLPRRHVRHIGARRHVHRSTFTLLRTAALRRTSTTGLRASPSLVDSEAVKITVQGFLRHRRHNHTSARAARKTYPAASVEHAGSAAQASLALLWVPEIVTWLVMRLLAVLA